MALMQWNTLFNTNIKVIDDQHQELVNILNSIYDLILIDNKNEEIGILIERLVEYTLTHFKTEEKLLEKYDYPETEEHKSEHVKLAKKATDYMNEYKSRKVDISEDLMHFLKDWLKNHIIHTDKKYGSYLNSKGVY